MHIHYITKKYIKLHYIELHACMHAYIPACINACVYVGTVPLCNVPDLLIYPCMYVCTQMHMNALMHARLQICVCICICVCTCACKCIRIVYAFVNAHAC